MCKPNNALREADMSSEQQDVRGNTGGNNNNNVDRSNNKGDQQLKATMTPATLTRGRKTREKKTMDLQTLRCSRRPDMCA